MLMFLLLPVLMSVFVYKELVDKCDQRGYHAPTELDSMENADVGKTCRGRTSRLTTPIDYVCHKILATY